MLFRFEAVFRKTDLKPSLTSKTLLRLLSADSYFRIAQTRVEGRKRSSEGDVYKGEHTWLVKLGLFGICNPELLKSGFAIRLPGTVGLYPRGLQIPSFLLPECKSGRAVWAREPQKRCSFLPITLEAHPTCFHFFIAFQLFFNKY
ncbi:hypothetical protein TH63_10115 [Rufibacter radiotolerans]|uniref:Uncharacterized protein n=1 Tax=Rufibacter radiotolerans TaxID=1379910 RepID=A0A0H4VKQ2_9BACT|nr:hypothetical protein TH63_10115 [Rufibacter radiotolerans]